MLLIQIFFENIKTQVSKKTKWVLPEWIQSMINYRFQCPKAQISAIFKSPVLHVFAIQEILGLFSVLAKYTVFLRYRKNMENKCFEITDSEGYDGREKR